MPRGAGLLGEKDKAVYLLLRGIQCMYYSRLDQKETEGSQIKNYKISRPLGSAHAPPEPQLVLKGIKEETQEDTAFSHGHSCFYCI